MAYDFDLFVLGAGSGGVRAARVAGSLGARVAICEERFYGGTCVNVGCVPKKLLMYGSRFGAHLQDAQGYGFETRAMRHDWGELISRKNAEISRLNGVYERLLDRFGVTRIWGRGVLVDEHTVAVDGKHYTAETLLIATGGRPKPPPFSGGEHTLNSDDVFFLPSRPKRIVLVGGGYIGVEFAAIFHGFGADVHLVHRGPCFLSGFDRDVRFHLEREYEKQGIHLHFNRNVVAVEPGVVYLDDGDPIEGDCIVTAIGRLPNTVGIGLEAIGVETAPSWEGAILVDDHLRTSVPNIYAVGDVIAAPRRLTPVALAEGMYVARALFGGARHSWNEDIVATAVFSRPNLGTVGLTEAEARKRHPDDVLIFRSEFKPMLHTMSGRDERTLMKLVVQRSTDKVLGAHMVGDDAGEIIQGIAVAMIAGATKAHFDQTIGIHPTAAEEFVTMRTPSEET